MDERAFRPLVEFLEKIPTVKSPVGTGVEENGLWWVKFQIDLDHILAWNTIQELSSVINYLSLEERLPTIFYPVSPPPYLNGGPRDFLSWVIETKDSDFKPGTLKKWLEGRLPRPIDDLAEWETGN